jgi:hypothetical protein
MRIKHLSLLAVFLSPLAVNAQQSQSAFNIQTDAFLFDGGPSLGNSDKVRWDFYKADSAGIASTEYVGGAYDATFEETIPVGRYVGVAALGNLRREVPLTITDGNVTQISATFNAGELTIRGKRSADNPIVEPLARIEARGENFTENFYGSRSFYVPAGDITLIGTLGPARTEEVIAVQAGQKLEHDLVIPSGVVFANATYAEGGLGVETGSVQFQVVSAEQTLDGSRENINSVFGVNKPIQLAAGKYLMRAKLGQVQSEAPFEIIPGQRTDLTLNLNAGVLAVEAPEAERIDISRLTNDLQQSEQAVSARYGMEHQDTLPPGKYTVTVSYPAKLKRDNRTVETEVTAANRTNLLIEIGEGQNEASTGN